MSRKDRRRPLPRLPLATAGQIVMAEAYTCGLVGGAVIKDKKERVAMKRRAKALASHVVGLCVLGEGGILLLDCHPDRGALARVEGPAVLCRPLCLLELAERDEGQTTSASGAKDESPRFQPWVA